MNSSNTGNDSKKTIHDKCGTSQCCGQCDTAIVIGDTPPEGTLKALEKAYPRFDEYGNYGENNPPLAGWKYE